MGTRHTLVFFNALTHKTIFRLPIFPLFSLSPIMPTTPATTSAPLSAAAAIRDIHMRVCAIGGNVEDTAKGLDAAIGMNPFIASGQKRLLEEVASIKGQDFHLARSDTDCIDRHFELVTSSQDIIIKMLKEQNKAAVQNEYKALMLSWKRAARTAQVHNEELSRQVQDGLRRERTLQCMLDSATATAASDTESECWSDADDGLKDMDLRPSKRARPSLPDDASWTCSSCHCNHSPTSPCYFLSPASSAYTPTSPEPIVRN